MSERPLIAGIDAGTSRIRAMVFTPEGEVVGEGSRPTPTTRPRPAWAEHDPEALWQATAAALREATRAVAPPARIVGIAVASVGETFIALDREQRPTCPVIAWYDERTTVEAARIATIVGRDRLYALTGLPPDPIFTLAKLLWLQAHHADGLARTASWLHLGHYLAWRLSGVPAGDASIASRTLALDLARRRWADDLILEVGLSPKTFPPLFACGTALGPVTAEAVATTGLPESCVVGVGGHDHFVGALAVDALVPGVLFDSMGTAEALTLTLDGPRPEPELGRQGFQQGVIEADRAHYYVLGGLPTSGGSVEWFRGLFDGALSHERLMAEAEEVPPGAGGVTYLPHLRGRFSPTPDPAARGAWFGLAADTPRSALYRAVLEGLAFDARHTIDALQAAPGMPAVTAIKAIGGSTRNPLLMRIKASVHRRPLAAAEMPEATALGAALFGGIAAGLFADLAAARRGLRPTWREVAPEQDWIAPYDAHYQALYRPAQAAVRTLDEAGRRLRDGA